MTLLVCNIVCFPCFALHQKRQYRSDCICRIYIISFRFSGRMQDNILSIDCTSCKLCKYTVLCRKNSRSKSLSQSCADHIHSILRRICGTHTLTHTLSFRIAAANRLNIDIAEILFRCPALRLRLSVDFH